MEQKKTNLKQAIVISGFPGCGKTYCFNHYKDKFLMLDSDSSNFSWKKDENGINTNIRNPHFPRNYIGHIIDNLDKADIIFVSSHEVVRRELERNGIHYYLVFPYDTEENKEEWVSRFEKRASPKSFINFISTNWSDFISDMEIDIYPIHIRLGKDYETFTHPWFIDDKILEELIEIEGRKNE